MKEKKAPHMVQIQWFQFQKEKSECTNMKYYLQTYPGMKEHHLVISKKKKKLSVIQLHFSLLSPVICSPFHPELHG